MPKAYQVTPHHSPDQASYAAIFRCASGKRLHRGLGTSELSQARLVCAGLVRLWTAGVRTASHVPPDVPLDAVRLYFGESATARDGALHTGAEQVDQALAAARAAVARFPPPARARLVPLFIERASLRRDNEQQRLELAALARELAAERAARKQLEQSVVIKAMESAAHAPRLSEALPRFADHMAARCSRGHTKDVLACVRAFAAALPQDLKLSHITPDAVAAFIDAAARRGNPERRATRYANWRVRLGAFLNWAARRWGYPSPMAGVRNVPRHAVEREHGEIHWHELREVETAIERLPHVYWQALVATLAYAGLQLAELCWLRVSDLEFAPDGTRGRLWVTTVSDPDQPGVRHTLKTAHRRRAVNLHPRLLLPRLQAHLAAGGAGRTFLFPLPATTRKRRRDAAPGSGERWLVGSLSTLLRGNKGGRRRQAQPGLLPPGMNAKSLRRTFGSLLLRSGKSSAEVAAALGNTEEIVRRHYARILGCEVNVDF